MASTLLKTTNSLGICSHIECGHPYPNEWRMQVKNYTFQKHWFQNNLWWIYDQETFLMIKIICPCTGFARCPKGHSGVGSQFDLGNTAVRGYLCLMVKWIY